MADLLTNTEELTSIASAIRTKGGTSSLLTYPQGFIDAIGAIPGPGPGPTPEPLPPDRKWTRPDDYPDLDSLDYSGDDNVIYAICDKAFAGDDTQVGGRNLMLTAGHIEDGEFFEDYQPVSNTFNLSWIGEDIFVLKIDVVGNDEPEWDMGKTHSIIEIYSYQTTGTLLKMSNLQYIKNCKIFKIPDNITSMEEMFMECHSLQSIEFDENFDTSNVTNMRRMFSACDSLQSLDVSNFNTSNVTDMGSMFSDCHSLQSLDLSNFNTSNVTNMEGMFSSCYSLQSLDVSSFNTSSVTNMGGMFNRCCSLQSLDVSNFNTSNVTSMWFMFADCTAFQSLDLSNFDTSNVTGSMDNMFANCPALCILKSPTIGWQESADFGEWPLFSGNFYATSLIDLFDKLPTITTTKTIVLDGALQYKLTDEEIAIAQNKGWTVSF